ncbi:hypothetical protein AB0N99_31100 [Streptomyces sp. NPDC093272]|uniref:hypothetical protein n=1 Tax=Streptomyces sp. NPDC093272 TaxID=3154981 RepID=UPI00342AD830
MSPTPPDRAPLRSAAEVNRDIRALWIGPGGHPSLRLNDEQRERYHRLLAELEQVQRGDVTTAA